MGELQPGVGYNLVQSPHGDSLEILFPPQIEYGPEQFKVKMVGDKVMVAKGRVVAQALTAMPTTMTLEYDVQGFAVYPTGKLTTGTDAASVWCSQGGNVEILKSTPGATEEDPPTGSNAWGVYLIRNRDNIGDVGQVVLGDRPFGVEALGQAVDEATLHVGQLGECECVGGLHRTSRQKAIRARGPMTGPQ